VSIFLAELLAFAAARELHCGAHLHTDTTDRPTDRHSNTLFALLVHKMTMMFNAMMMMKFTAMLRDPRARSPAR
jgi:hypothetical protein